MTRERWLAVLRRDSFDRFPLTARHAEMTARPGTGAQDWTEARERLRRPGAERGGRYVESTLPRTRLRRRL